MTIPPMSGPFPGPSPAERPDDSLERKAEIAALRALAEILGKVVVEDDQGNFGLNVLGLSGVTGSIDDVAVNLADEYSDGGEARAKNRLLGNTDAFDLAFITSGTSRLKIKDDGDIGIGTAATGSPDELLHISKTVGAGDVALLIENSFGNVVSSPPTTETASLKFGFGGINTAAQVQVGKNQDFTTGPDEDAFMAFLVSDSGVLAEAMRLVGGSSVFLGLGTTLPNELATIEGRISLKDSQATPATTVGYGKIYVKADGDLYYLDPTGTETSLLAAGGDSDWTIDGVTQFSAVSGNVGIGPVTAATIDEKLHVQESNDGADTAILIENSFTNTASSTDETASLKFGFGGVNTAGLIRVGKTADFTPSADNDSFMDFAVLGDDVAIPLMRLRGRVPVIGSSPSVTIGSGDGGHLSVAGSVAFCQVQLPTGTGMTTTLNLINEDATAPRLRLSGPGSGIFSLRAESTNLSIVHDGLSNATIVQFRSVLVDVRAPRFRVLATGVDAALELTAGAGSDSIIKFQDSTPTTHWSLFMDNTSDNDLFIESGIVGGLRLDRTNGALSIGAGVAPKDPNKVAFTIKGTDTGSGAAQQNMFSLLHGRSNAAAQVDDTLITNWWFEAVSGPGRAARQTVGKVEDFTSTANESSFMKWEIKDDGTNSEVLRFEGGGGIKIGFFAATPVVKPTVTGSRGGNAALADLLTDLAGLGLITDSSTA